MFRRAVVGYDRFQVDTYVRWAEDELATADREREHLVARVVRTQADLEESRQLLSHSAAGGEFLQVSRRIGALLATAADEAEGLRADAEADRRRGVGGGRADLRPCGAVARRRRRPRPTASSPTRRRGRRDDRRGAAHRRRGRARAEQVRRGPRRGRGAAGERAGESSGGPPSRPS